MFKMIFEFIKDPKHTGAVLPSSKFLAQKMVDVEFSKDAFVAEIGPGDGIFTKEILTKIDNEENFFAMEINPNFVKKLKDKFPNLDIENMDANEIYNILQSKNISALDVVISGLPWANFGIKEQLKMIKNIHKSLKDDGYFITFAYKIPSPKAMLFKRVLHRTFNEVKTSKIVWKNIPPAFVYYCKK